MTREEAVEYGLRWKNAIIDRSDTECSEAIQFFNMAIQALEQEPSEDCISREDLSYKVGRYYEERGDFGSFECFWILGAIRNAPSVVPNRATGKWVLDPNGMDWNLPAWRCSECGFVANYIGVEANGLGSNPMNWAGSNYCPNCGARMIEE